MNSRKVQEVFDKFYEHENDDQYIKANQATLMELALADVNIALTVLGSNSLMKGLSFQNFYLLMTKWGSTETTVGNKTDQFATLVLEEPSILQRINQILISDPDISKKYALSNNQSYDANTIKKILDEEKSRREITKEVSAQKETKEEKGKRVDDKDVRLLTDLMKSLQVGENKDVNTWSRKGYFSGSSTVIDKITDHLKKFNDPAKALLIFISALEKNNDNQFIVFPVINHLLSDSHMRLNELDQESLRKAMTKFITLYGGHPTRSMYEVYVTSNNSFSSEFRQILFQILPFIDRDTIKKMSGLKVGSDCTALLKDYLQATSVHPEHKFTQDEAEYLKNINQEFNEDWLKNKKIEALMNQRKEMKGVSYSSIYQYLQVVKHDVNFFEDNWELEGRVKEVMDLLGITHQNIIDWHIDNKTWLLKAINDFDENNKILEVVNRHVFSFQDIAKLDPQEFHSMLTLTTEKIQKQLEVFNTIFSLSLSLKDLAKLDPHGPYDMFIITPEEIKERFELLKHTTVDIADLDIKSLRDVLTIANTINAYLQKKQVKSFDEYKDTDLTAPCLLKLNLKDLIEDQINNLKEDLHSYNHIMQNGYNLVLMTEKECNIDRQTFFQNPTLIQLSNGGYQLLGFKNNHFESTIIDKKELEKYLTNQTFSPSSKMYITKESELFTKLQKGHDHTAYQKLFQNKEAEIDLINVSSLEDTTKTIKDTAERKQETKEKERVDSKAESKQKEVSAVELIQQLLKEASLYLTEVKDASEKLSSANDKSRKEVYNKLSNIPQDLTSLLKETDEVQAIKKLQTIQTSITELRKYIENTSGFRSDPGKFFKSGFVPEIEKCLTPINKIESLINNNLLLLAKTKDISPRSK